MARSMGAAALDLFMSCVEYELILDLDPALPPLFFSSEFSVPHDSELFCYTRL